jgi:hypothetical protein
MSKKRRSPEFKLVEIRAFDARRGYKRCSDPGRGCHIDGGPSGTSDFWKDKNNKLVVRISSQGYAYHFEASLSSGKPIPESKMLDFAEHLTEILFEWLADGVDYPPSSIYES